MFVAKAADAAQGVEITIVYASHVNNAPPALLSEAHRAALEADGAILEYGPPTGFVVKFTNGLTAYLSGDTGIHSEMRTVVNEYHHAKLAVLNLGNNPGIYASGAHVINELIQPTSVDPHACERARDGRREAAAAVAHSRAHRAARATGSPRHQRAHDGVRRAGAVCGGVLIPEALVTSCRLPPATRLM